MKYTPLLLIAMSATIFGCGCNSALKFVAPLTNVTGNDIAAATALVIAAKPHTDAAGKPLLDQANGKLSHAATSLDRATKQYIDGLNTAQNARAKAEAERDKLYNSWGAKFQRFVEKVVFWTCVCVGIYVLVVIGLHVAEFYVTGPFLPTIVKITKWLSPIRWLGKLNSALTPAQSK
jgi:hypothetical protein